MKGITIYLDEYTGFRQRSISFEKVESYKIKKGFLCLNLIDGKVIYYDISRIERFEVETEDW